MITIYALSNKENKCYVGSTSRNLNTRRSEHISHCCYGSAEVVENVPKDEIKIELLENCDDEKRYERENYWIEELRKKYTITNKGLAGKGCKQFNVHQNTREAARKLMLERWANQREKMLTRVNAHKTSEFQSEAGKLGAAARLAKGRVFQSQ